MRRNEKIDNQKKIAKKKEKKREKKDEGYFDASICETSKNTEERACILKQLVY